MNIKVKDSDGNIYDMIRVSSIPEGYEEVVVPEELAGEELRFLECVDDVIQKKSTADVDRRNEILDVLRAARDPLLADADIQINKIEDIGGDVSAHRTYRQALRDVPAAFIKVDGDPKVSTDTIDIETFEWPVKPE